MKDWRVVSMGEGKGIGGEKRGGNGRAMAEKQSTRSKGEETVFLLIDRRSS